jgi:tetratricopeptide (TPR) repeat protein
VWGAEARDQLRRGLEAWRALPPSERTDSLLEIRALLGLLRDPVSADEQMRTAREFEAAVAALPPSQDRWYWLSISYQALADAVYSKGDVRAAVAYLDIAAGILEPDQAINPVNFQIRRDLARAHMVLVERLAGPDDELRLGDEERGLIEADRAVEMMHAILAMDPRDERAREDTADALYLAADVWTRRSPERALAALEEARRLLGPGMPRELDMISRMNAASSAALLRLGRTEEAVVAAERAAAHARTVQNSGILAQLARVYYAAGRTVEAQVAIAEAQAYAESQYTAAPSELHVLIKLARVHETRGDLAALAGARDEARAAYRRALAVWDEWPKTVFAEFPARQRVRVEQSLANVGAP